MYASLVLTFRSVSPAGSSGLDAGLPEIKISLLIHNL